MLLSDAAAALLGYHIVCSPDRMADEALAKVDIEVLVVVVIFQLCLVPWHFAVLQNNSAEDSGRQPAEICIFLKPAWMIIEAAEAALEAAATSLLQADAPQVKLPRGG